MPHWRAMMLSSIEWPRAARIIRKQAAPQFCSLDWKKCGMFMLAQKLLRHAPEPNRGVAAGGEGPAAVGGEEDAADFVGVPLELADFLALFDVPQPSSVVGAAG